MDDELVSTIDVGQQRTQGFSWLRGGLSAAAHERLLYLGAAVSYICIRVFVTEVARVRH